MKGVLSNVRGQKLGGTLTINVRKSNQEEIDVRTRLVRVLPNYPLAGFNPIIPTLIKEKALSLSNDDFIEKVRIKLLTIVIIKYPEETYPDDTTLYNAFWRLYPNGKK